MAHHYSQPEKAAGLVGNRVFLEEFELTSFGESLVPADIVDSADGVVALKTVRDFSLGTLVRMDLSPYRRTRDGASDGFVVVGCVRDSRRVSAGEVYRVEVAFLRLRSERYNTMLSEIEAM
jgi:hypothetical protein